MTTTTLILLLAVIWVPEDEANPETSTAHDAGRSGVQFVARGTAGREVRR